MDAFTVLVFSLNCFAALFCFSIAIVMIVKYNSISNMIINLGLSILNVMIAVMNGIKLFGDKV